VKKWILSIVVGLLVSTTGVAPLALGKESSGVETVNLTTWKHPVKDVFESYEVKVNGVKLAQNRTYPVFDVTLPYPVTEEYESSFNALVADIARENAYWSFELADRKQSIVVKVECDRKKREVTQVWINGSATFFDRAFEEELSKIRSADKLNSVAKGDLDGDKQIEYIVSRENPYDDYLLLYVVQWNGQRFVNRGKLWDPIGAIVHDLDDVEIVKLDKTGQKYIAVYMHVGMSGYGFRLYRWSNGHIEHLLTNAPTATGKGARYLEDIDRDGIADNVSAYSYFDTQMHTIYSYHRFDQPAAVKYKIVYENEKKKFIYPNTPEDVIANYIEDCYWSDVLRGEMKKLIVSEEVLKFKVEDYIYLGMMEYGGLELEFTTISNKNGVRIIECRDGYSSDSDSKPLLFTMVKQNGVWKIKGISAAG